MIGRFFVLFAFGASEIKSENDMSHELTIGRRGESLADTWVISPKMLESLDIDEADAEEPIVEPDFASIIEDAMADQKSHPEFVSDDWLVANVAMRFMKQTGLDILAEYPDLISSSERREAIRKILTVMDAMGYSFSDDEQIGMCGSGMELFDKILAQSTEELVEYSALLTAAYEGMEALTASAGIDVRYSYSPMGLLHFYCVPALSPKQYESRLDNMRAVAMKAGSDSLALHWAPVMGHGQADMIKRELPSLLAIALNSEGEPLVLGLESIAAFIDFVTSHPMGTIQIPDRAQLALSVMVSAMQRGMCSAALRQYAYALETETEALRRAEQEIRMNRRMAVRDRVAKVRKTKPIRFESLETDLTDELEQLAQKLPKQENIWRPLRVGHESFDQTHVGGIKQQVETSITQTIH